MCLVGQKGAHRKAVDNIRTVIVVFIFTVYLMTSVTAKGTVANGRS